tara:strand:- start:3101 stop:3286 length:186 start_codon:yes stop_codon:yes gene_type:complete
MDILNYKWFLMGAVLGLLQFAWILYRGKKEIPGPGQFLLYGAILGSLVYGSIIWVMDKFIF